MTQPVQAPPIKKCETYRFAVFEGTASERGFEDIASELGRCDCPVDRSQLPVSWRVAGPSYIRKGDYDDGHKCSRWEARVKKAAT